MATLGPSIAEVQAAADEPTQPEPVTAQEPAAAATVSLKRLAIRGVAWSVAGYGASQLLRLASSLILTRLLFPQAFGLMALVNVFIRGLKMFSDIGVGPSIVRSRREDEAFLNTAWTFQIFRGIILFLVALLLAVPLSRLYNTPQLAVLLAVAGGTALISGFNSPALFTLNRQLQLAKVVKRDLLAQLCATTTMIAWAAIAPSVWALLAGGVVSSVVLLALSHQITTHTLRLCWERHAVQELMRFGIFIFISTAASFVGGGSERLILGGFITLEQLGQFSIALMIAHMPILLVQQLTNRVLFPSVSQLLRRDRAQAIALHRRARVLFMVLSIGMLAFWIICGPIVIQLLYDPRYHAAGWMLQFLAIRVVYETVRFPQQKMLAAVGKPIYHSISSVVLAFTVAGGLAITLTLGHLKEAMVLLALSPVPGLFILTYGMGRHFPEVRKSEWLDATALLFLAFGTVYLLY